MALNPPVNLHYFTNVYSCLTFITNGAFPSSLTSTSAFPSFNVTSRGNCTVKTALVLTIRSVYSLWTFYKTYTAVCVSGSGMYKGTCKINQK